jgi:hypothetical protein
VAPPTATQQAALLAALADQRSGLALPAFATQNFAEDAVGLPCLIGIVAPIASATLSDWFPLMPSIDSAGGTSGLLLHALTVTDAQMVYVNAATPLTPAALAAILAIPGADPLRFGPDTIPAGGALLFACTVAADAIIAGPLQAALGFALPSLPMQGRVDFSSGFPVLTLGASLDATFGGDLAEARLEVSSPLYPVPGDARITLLGSVVIAQGETVDLQAVVPADGPIVATVTVDPVANKGFASRFATQPDLPDLTLTESASLTIQLGRANGSLSLQSLAFSVTVQDWKLIGGWLTIDSATLSLTVTNPLDSALVLATLIADASFGKGATPLRLSGSGSYPSGAYSLALLDTGASLGAMLADFGVTASDLGALAITAGSVTYDRQSRTMAAQMAVGGNWTIGPFVLESLSVNLQGPATLRATVAAQFTLGGVAFTASATYTNGGWSLQASGNAGANGLPLGAMLSDLTSRVGFTVPDFVNSILLDDFSLTYDTASSGLTVQLVGILSVGPGFRISVRIAVAQSTTGRTATVTGSLVSGQLEMDLVIQGDTVTASLADPAGLDLGPQDIAGLFGLTLPGALQGSGIQLQALRLSYDGAPAPA